MGRLIDSTLYTPAATTPSTAATPAMSVIKRSIAKDVEEVVMNPYTPGQYFVVAQSMNQAECPPDTGVMLKVRDDPTKGFMPGDEVPLFRPVYTKDATGLWTVPGDSCGSLPFNRLDKINEIISHQIDELLLRSEAAEVASRFTMYQTNTLSMSFGLKAAILTIKKNLGTGS